MKAKKISVFAPATVANIGCGFDILGMAIYGVGDLVTIVPNTSEKLIIKSISGDGKKLTKNIHENIVAISIQALLTHLNSKQGFDIYLKKQMPLSSGLGSSAASSVAGLYAANLFLGSPLSKQELVPFAMEGERIACGTAHADNVAPSLLGGIVLCRNNVKAETISLPVPKQLYVVVVHPHYELKTSDSRKALPKKIDLKTGALQWSNTASFVHALHTNNFELLADSITDFVAEPRRKSLIPHFAEVKGAALLNGGLACSISGSGPSIFCIAKGKKNAEKAAAAMKNIYKNNKMGVDVYISNVNTKGAQQIK